MKLKPEDVIRALDGSRRMTLPALALRIDGSESSTNKLLQWMLKTGTVRRVREHAAEIRGPRSVFIYYTSDPQPVGKPYRDMRLTETLTGYSATLTRHMALCNTRRFA